MSWVTETHLHYWTVTSHQQAVENYIRYLYTAYARQWVLFMRCYNKQLTMNEWLSFLVRRKVTATSLWTSVCHISAEIN